MKEAFKMWKYSNMIALTILTAGIYTAALIPFKSIPIIPGFTEIRPAALFPVLFGLLFGPAGAWGSAIGNLIADLFGTLSSGSIFGFAGNFLFAYIPYKIWGNTVNFLKNDKIRNTDTGRKLIEFGIVSITASAACAVVISWGSDALKLVPFAALSSIIAINNTVVSMVLGPVVLTFLYPRVKKMGLLWTDIMRKDDISQSQSAKFYSLLVVFGSLGALIIGLIISVTFANQTLFTAGLAAASAGNICVSLGVLPFIIIMFFGATKL